MGPPPGRRLPCAGAPLADAPSFPSSQAAALRAIERKGAAVTMGAGPGSVRTVQRVVFLDFDGVLNSRGFFDGMGLDERSVDDLRRRLDPLLVARVQRLCAMSGACVVVSSSWRLRCKLPRLKRALAERGLEARVVGTTPCVPGAARGAEVARWLERHPVDGIVVLDDEEDMEGLSPWLVRTRFLTGITDDDVRLAAEVLRRPAPGRTEGDDERRVLSTRA